MSEIASGAVPPLPEPQKDGVPNPPLICKEPSSTANAEIHGDDISAPTSTPKDDLPRPEEEEVEAKLAGSPPLPCSENLRGIRKDDDSPGSSIETLENRSGSSDQQDEKAEVKLALPREMRLLGMTGDGAPSSLAPAVQEPKTRPLARPPTTEKVPPLRPRHRHGYGEGSSRQTLGDGHRPPHHRGGDHYQKAHPVQAKTRPPVPFSIHRPRLFHGQEARAPANMNRPYPHAYPAQEHMLPPPYIYPPPPMAYPNGHQTAVFNYVNVYVVPGYPAPSCQPNAAFNPAADPYFPHTFIPTDHTTAYQYPPLPPPPPPLPPPPPPPPPLPKAVPYPTLQVAGPSNARPTEGAIAIEVSEDELLKILKRQIEYYFSDENLETDVYLKSLMNRNGFVDITSIAPFFKTANLLKKISRLRGTPKEDHSWELESLAIIKKALLESTEIEIVGDKLRRRNEWEKYCPANN